jgi:hypothetical protein
MTLFCPVCQTDLETTDIFCSSCGKQLQIADKVTYLKKTKSKVIREDDPEPLEEKLDELLNDGWQIKGLSNNHHWRYVVLLTKAVDV